MVGPEGGLDPTGVVGQGFGCVEPEYRLIRLRAPKVERAAPLCFRGNPKGCKWAAVCRGFVPTRFWKGAVVCWGPKETRVRGVRRGWNWLEPIEFPVPLLCCPCEEKILLLAGPGFHFGFRCFARKLVQHAPVVEPDVMVPV